MLFLPVGNGLWNASDWILFNEVSIENSWESKCYFKEDIHRLFKTNSECIDLKSYFVKEKDFEKYRKRKDIGYVREIERLKQIESSQGLLLEFLSLYYALNKNKEKLIDFGWHTDPSNKHHTDLDAYIITNDRGIIIQAKKSINIRDPNFEVDLEKTENDNFDQVKELKIKEDLDNIGLLDHFKKAEQILRARAKSKSIEIKSIDKILFIFEKDLEDWILKELNKEEIKLISFEDVEKDKETFNKDFVDKINFIFDRIFYPDDQDDLE